MRALAGSLIAATDAFDREAALALVSPDAVIDDPSTGHRFVGEPGIRDYVTSYFVDRTVMRLLSLKPLGKRRARIRVDFTGDFGHEIGHSRTHARRRGPHLPRRREARTTAAGAPRWRPARGRRRHGHRNGIPSTMARAENIPSVCGSTGAKNASSDTSWPRAVDDRSFATEPCVERHFRRRT